MTTKVTNTSKEKKRIWHQGRFLMLAPGESVNVEKSLSGNVKDHPDFKVEEVAESEEKKPKTTQKKV